MRTIITIETDDRFLADNLLLVANKIINEHSNGGCIKDEDDFPLAWTVEKGKELEEEEE